MGSLRGATTQLIAAYRKCGVRAAEAEEEASLLSRKVAKCR